MHIISWNVAGWGPTYTTILQHYGSLDRYLELHDCDVFCIQESKISHSKASELQTVVEAVRAGLEIDGVAEVVEDVVEDVDGGAPGVDRVVDRVPVKESEFPPSLASQRRRKWSSFFAFNRVTTHGQQGFNGVACFVRTDKYPVYGATQRVFYDPLFDDEGRALLIDFGTHRLLNIYAPFANSPDATEEKLQFKLRFLQKLEGRYFKKVDFEKNYTILLGDFNVSWRKEDVKIARRLLEVDENGRVVQGAPAELFPGALSLNDGGDDEDIAMAKAEADSSGVESGESGFEQGFGGNGNGIGGNGSVGKSGKGIKGKGKGKSSSSANASAKAAASKSPALAKAVTKVQPNILDAFRNGGFDATASKCSSSSSSNGVGNAVSDNKIIPAVQKRRFISCGFAASQLNWPLNSFKNLGLPRHMRYEYNSVVWLQKFLARKAVDVWAYIYGNCKHSAERFTVWNQFTSDRMANNGSRIDFILLSRPFFAKMIGKEGLLTEAITTPGGGTGDDSQQVSSAANGNGENQKENKGTNAPIRPNLVIDPETNEEITIPPENCLLRKIGYLESEELAHSIDYNPSSTFDQKPTPLDLPGHRRPLERGAESNSRFKPRTENPAGAALHAATCFGGWTARGFGTTPEAQEAQRDDMRLNNSQFQHSAKASKLYKLNHWSRGFEGILEKMSGGGGEVDVGGGMAMDDGSREGVQGGLFEDGGIDEEKTSSTGAKALPLIDLDADLDDVNDDIINLDSSPSPEVAKKKYASKKSAVNTFDAFRESTAVKKRVALVEETRFLKKRRSGAVQPIQQQTSVVESATISGTMSSASASTASGASPIIPTTNNTNDLVTSTSSVTTTPLPIPPELATALSKKRHIANMIYIPPSYSDHIMISLFIPDEILKTLEIKPLGIPPAQTMATHPWRGKTRDMFEFMGKKV